MTSLTENRPSVSEVSSFLTDYCDRLISSGTTCIRLEKNARRIAASFGMSADPVILPRHIQLTVNDPESETEVTTIRAIGNRPVCFEIITRLSRLSWDIADHKVDFRSGIGKFREITDDKRQNSWLLLLLVSLANASFCRLFGGDITAMTIVFIATFAGFAVKQTLTERHADQRVTVVICALISSVLAAADGLIVAGTTPAVTVGTSVLYLVPGIPFINSFCDMIDGHYICAFCRLTSAVITTCCLSIGLCGGMMLMNLGMF